LLLNDPRPDLDSLQLIKLIDLCDLVHQMAHQGCDVLVGSQLASVANRDAAQRALLLALPVVGLDAVGAEAVQAGSVDHRAADQFLADRTSQVLHHTFDEVLPDVVVQYQRLRHSKSGLLLVEGVVNLIRLQKLHFLFVMVA